MSARPSSRAEVGQGPLGTGAASLRLLSGKEEGRVVAGRLHETRTTGCRRL